MRFLTTIICALFVSSTAGAQQTITNFNQDTVFKSMQCEIGLFGIAAKRAGLDPAMQAHIKYSTTGSTEVKASVEAGVGGWLGKLIQGPKAEAAADFGRVDSNTLEGKLNVNKGNTGACIGSRKRNAAIPLGINDCLTDGLAALQGGFTTTCSRKVTAKATFDASGKFVFWVITIGPDFSGGYTVTYQIDVDAPAKDDSKRAEAN
jgi:hypothetical protein